MPWLDPVRIRVFDPFAGEWRDVDEQGDPGPAPTAPGVPVDLDYTATQTTALLTWDAGEGAEVDYYEVALGVGRSLVASPGDSRLSLTGLTPDTTYGPYWVRAIGAPPGRLASGWSSPGLFVRTAQTTTPPPTGTTLGGFSAANISTAVATYGSPDIVRQYYGGGDSLPLPVANYPSYLTTPWATSWKPYTGSGKAAVNASLLAIAGGSKDAIFRDFLTRLTTGNTVNHRVYLVDHEPDVKANKGEFDMAPFCQAWNHFAEVLHAHPKRSQLTCVLGTGGYSIATRIGGFAGIDRDLVDVVAWDPYAVTVSAARQKTYEGGRFLIERDIPTWRAAFPNARFGIGEFGTNFSVPFGTDAQLSEFIRGCFDAARDNDFDHITYFHLNANEIPAGYPLSRAQLRIGSGN